MKIPSREKNCDTFRSRKRSPLGLAAALLLGGLIGSSGPTAWGVEPVNQGQDWTPAAQADFYTRDQGSQVIKYAWLQALKRPDGQPFMADQLNRYGYLANPGNPDGLPVGFTKARDYVGMNCAACHTRQISVDGKDYRIDGGPAIVDVQSFFADLGHAVSDVRATDAKFLAFAQVALGQPSPDPSEVEELKADVKLWFDRYDALMSRALPTPSWGPGRLDAVGMIFNRLTGLDLGPAPDHIITGNIKPADAPVRYPFLWNAWIQDMTQWPGFSGNGNDVLGLSRNLGEVFGVFANFAPKKEWWHLSGVNFLATNSANFDGLGRLEGLIKKIGRPKYPWKIDADLAEKGRALYERSDLCFKCHKIDKTIIGTWRTPIQDVGTDGHEHDILDRTAATGVLEGKGFPYTANLGEVDRAFNILKLSVIGSIVQHAVPILPAFQNNLAAHAITEVAPQQLTQLENARANFRLPPGFESLERAFVDAASRRATTNVEALAVAPPAIEYKYESRVMEGVWAAAPYLHNGSVPTLAALLEHRDKRPKSFKIGPNYDINDLGIAKDQTKFGDQTLVTSDDSKSGNYNGGHEGPAFGTELSPEDKKALLEYLKML